MTPTINRGGQDAPVSYEIMTPYGVYEDDVLKKLQAKIPKSQAFMWMRKLAAAGAKGRMVPKRLAKQHKVSHFEERDWFPARATIASADNGTPNQTTITLSAADHFDSGKTSYPKVTMTAVFPDESLGYVSAVNKTTDNAHTVTIVRQNTTHDVQAASIAGNEVVFYSNIQGEASGKIGSHVPGFDRYDFFISTTREDIEITDHEMQNATWFEWKGQKKVYIKALDEMADKFAMQEELKLLIGDEAENITDPNGRNVHTGKGLIPQITDAGINFDYYGDPTLTTLENLELLLDKFYGDNENLIISGINADQGWRNWLLEFTQHSDRGITFSGYDKQTVGIDLKSATMGSYTFHFDCWRILSHKESLGAKGMPYSNMIICIPMGGGNAYMPGADGFMEKEYRDYFRLVYSKTPGKNKVVDDVFTWDHGALASNHSNDVLSLNVGMVSYKTLELMALNKFGIARRKDV